MSRDRHEWTIDVVAAACLSDDDRRQVARAADEQSRPDLRGRLAVDVETAFPHEQPAFHYDRRDGATRIGVTGLHIGDTATYKSANDRLYSHAGMGSDDVGSTRVHFPAILTMRGTVPPHSVIEALAGRHVRDVVDHAALEHPDLVVRSAHLNGSTGRWTGFGVELPTIPTPLDPARPQA